MRMLMSNIDASYLDVVVLAFTQVKDRSVEEQGTSAYASTVSHTIVLCAHAGQGS